MRLRIDPTQAGAFVKAVREAAAAHQAGEFVEITPAGGEGSGLVHVTLRPLDPGVKPRLRRQVYGSMRESRGPGV